MLGAVLDEGFEGNADAGCGMDALRDAAVTPLANCVGHNPRIKSGLTVKLAVLIMSNQKIFMVCSLNLC